MGRSEPRPEIGPLKVKRMEVSRDITVGKVTVRLEVQYDESPDLSYLGEGSSYRAPQTASQKLVHRGEWIVLDHKGVWRDEKGRIAAAPEDNGRRARECEYTWHDYGHERGKHALVDSARLERFWDGSLSCYGVCATVLYDGVKIAHASVWGIESDSGDSYFDECKREEAHEALKEARRWIGRNLQAAG